MGCETRNKMEQANHNLQKQQSSWTQWVDVSWFLPKPIPSTKPINSFNSSSLPASRIGAFESVKPLTSALASRPAVPSHPSHSLEMRDAFWEDLVVNHGIILRLDGPWSRDQIGVCFWPMSPWENWDDYQEFDHVAQGCQPQIEWQTDAKSIQKYTMEWTNPWAMLARCSILTIAWKELGVLYCRAKLHLWYAYSIIQIPRLIMPCQDVSSIRCPGQAKTYRPIRRSKQLHLEKNVKLCSLHRPTMGHLVLRLSS